MSLGELRGVSGRGDHTLHTLGVDPVAPPTPTPAVRSRVLVGSAPARQSQPQSGPARPRPLPTARGRPARRSRSYKSRLRARGPGHSEQLRRGDCTARPAGPAPTGARRLQQPQHRDLGPRAGYGCALGLSAQGDSSTGVGGEGGAVWRPGPRDRPFPFGGGALSPTPLPNSSGRDGPRPSAWLGASSLRNVVVGAAD
ncbi:Hypothetical predicted protein [Lynx pardinus]|uniref:Uncharacterized protein n=1 Tax=Lynx pardinus TaxID=191816 RepID=A0A485MFC8_LYNPA|nr:Hypothetical predicted protein [Lynx pardinus]